VQTLESMRRSRRGDGHNASSGGGEIIPEQSNAKPTSERAERSG
jgi:hypothetical protein